jgi:hypothetical protein
MDNPDQYKPTHSLKGVWLFFVSRQDYLDAAIEHVVWLNLQAEDLRRKYLEGKFSPPSESDRTLELRRYEILRSQFLNSFGQIAFLATLALLIGVYLGLIGVDFKFHPGKGMGFSGTFLVAWAALFELGGSRLASWDGETLSEIIHPKIFQLLFIPGTFALMCSILF